jgi:hypothetical protein
MHSLFIIL